ncbi:M56 family metallopeptidase [uncultured Aquimarina sp.]|uniref:M56 family metallopeptidase n=1 Tax=uncultured Aquimarina sp. TaxID=575652 RepID=UPI0026333ABE|nr:M56 family metallopeptidase [uncultured Aquimarina sp.]
MEAFLIYLLKSSVILSLFYLVYFFLLRKDTFFKVNRHFLLTGIISSLLLPFLEFTTIEFIEKPIFQTIAYNSSDFDILKNQPEPTNWWLVVFNLYVAIALLLLGRFILQLISLLRIFKRSQNRLNEGFSFFKTSEDIAPFSFFKYIIFNPLLHDTKELEMILKHEKIHAKQYHTVDLLITNIFAIFQWINPFIWFYKKSLQQNLEFIADQEATRDLPSKKEYQLTLVKVSSSNYSSITNNFYQSLIKKRIVMLNKKESKQQNLWKTTIILPLLCLFLWSFNTKTEIHYIQSKTKDQTTSAIEDLHNEADVILEEIKPSIKEENNIKTSAHSFPSKKEHPNTIEHQNIIAHVPVTTELPVKITTPTEEKPLIKSKNTKVKKNVIEFIINKNATKDHLEKVKRVFKNEYDVIVTFSDINRDSNDEITSISVKVSSKKSNANFSVSNDTPITPFVLSYDSKNDKINIGQSSSGHKNIWISKNKHNKHSNSHVIEINSGDEGESLFIVEGDKKHKRKVIRKKGNKNKFIIKSDHNDDEDHIFINSDDHKTIFDFDGNSGKDPLFFIDGKEASEKEVKKLKSDEIQSIDISKGKGSVKKYGKKAKDGVINITTKKNTKKETGFKINIDKNNVSIGEANIRPLIFVDGKKVSHNEFEKIKHKQIESVNVYKAEKAVQKYGNGAKNGVVEVILKK